MLDSDMIVVDNLLDMIKPGHDVVSATTFSCKHGIPYPLIMKYATDKKGFEPMFDQGDVIEEYTEVDGIGTGCIYIRRSVFDKIDAPFFRFEYASDGEINLGEDYSFSKKVQEAGIKLYVATKFIVGHFKYFDAAHINQLLHKGLTFNQQGIAKTLADRIARQLNGRLK